MAFQDRLSPLLQLGVVTVEVDMAQKLPGTLYSTETTFTPQAALLFCCRNKQENYLTTISRFIRKKGRFPWNERRKKKSLRIGILQFHSQKPKRNNVICAFYDYSVTFCTQQLFKKNQFWVHNWALPFKSAHVFICMWQLNYLANSLQGLQTTPEPLM